MTPEERIEGLKRTLADAQKEIERLEKKVEELKKEVERDPECGDL